MSNGAPVNTSISFTNLIKKYSELQQSTLAFVNSVAGQSGVASPGKFLLIQFKMSQVTQVGQSVSNLLAQVNSMINNTVRNQRSQ